MSQATDYTIANASGAAVRSDLNTVLGAVATNNSGTSAPGSQPFMMWIDTTDNLIKMRNGADDGWITLPLAMNASNQTAGNLSLGATSGSDRTFTINSAGTNYFSILPTNASDKVTITAGNTGSDSNSLEFFVTPSSGTETKAMTIESDGVIKIEDTSAPGTTTNRLYSVSGDIYWDGNQLNSVTDDFPLLAPAGSASAPSYSFTGDANTGIYQVSADSVGIATGGTVGITLDSSQNTTFAGAIDVTGAVTANAGVVVDNITIDGTTIALSSGDLTLDVAGDILLDADDADVRMIDGGVDYCKFTKSGNDTVIKSQVSDGNMIFKGSDGGSEITVLTFDMENAGIATFNSKIVATELDISGDLDVDGTTNLDIVDIDGAVDMASTLAVAGAVTFNDAGADVDFRVESDGNANMLFVDGGNNRVGIGSSSPDAELEIELPAGGTPELRITTGSIYTKLISDDATGFNALDFSHTLYIKEAGTTIGTLAVGNWALPNKLGVGSTDLLAACITATDTTGRSPATSGNATGHVVIGKKGDSGLAMGSNNTGGFSWLQAAALDSAGTTNKLALNPIGGNVGIGVSDPDSNLDISGGSNKLGILRITQRASGAAAYGLDMGLDPSSGDPVFSRIVNDVVSEVFRIERSSGDVGIGTASSFGKLSVNVSSGAPATSGNMTNGLTVHNTDGGRAIQLGVNESGAYTFINSGYVNSAGNSQPLAIFTGGAERMRIDSSGNVGIGTATPGYLLHGVVDGSEAAFTITSYRNDSGQTRVIGQKARGSKASPTLVQDDDTIFELQGWGYDGDEFMMLAAIDFQVDGTAANNNMPGRIAFSTNEAGGNPTDRMIIDSVGRVGIGRTPSISNSKLEVGGADNVSLINVEASGYTGGMGIGSTGLQFFHGATAHMRIDSSGLVSIGQATTGGSLAIKNASSTYLDLDSASSVNAGLRLYEAGTFKWQLFNDGDATDNYTIDHATGTALLITQTGRMSLGSSNTNAKFNAYTNESIYTGSFVNSHASAPRGIAFEYTGAAPDSAADWFMYCEDTSGQKMGVSSDGDVWTSDSGILTSDRSLKTDIVDATPKLDDINNLQVRNFKWIPEYHSKKQHKHIGFIADEFETVFPGLVTENENPLKSRTEPIKNIRYGALVPILVKAVQELSAEVEELKSKMHDKCEN